MIQKLKQSLIALHRGNRAVTAIEYALIAALIAVSVIGAVSSMGTSIAATFGNVSTQL
jgi:pilus assembly protein Flp/PilA